MKSTLDHLAIVAPDLDTGCAFVTRVLGVELEPGAHILAWAPTTGYCAWARRLTWK
ncbi:VOC family protein [Pseudomonas sp. TH31]|uniref:VOC family protein n=1 Tax=Pseudomonas sp. TH31 TaxID=2796396 RepID=UPI001F5B8A6D|nr:VOC family protein [Pseudomonas sp. TH31]